MTAWYVLRTQASQEHKAKQRVEALGHEAYCPMTEVWRRPSRHARYREKIRKQIALFPRYLFLGLQEGAQSAFYDLATIPAVIGWISSAAGPTMLSGAIVEDIKERFGDCMTETTEKEDKLQFKVGDKVRIVDGFLASNRVLKVVGRRGDHVLVGMSMLGADNVAIGLEYLEKAE